MNQYSQNNYQNRGSHDRRPFKRKMNTDILIYVFIAIAILAAGIQMDFIKIPGLNTKKTLNLINKSKSKSETRDRKTQPESSSDKKTTNPDKNKTPCGLDCNSIPGSSCVNGKCTDPYLQL